MDTITAASKLKLKDIVGAIVKTPGKKVYPVEEIIIEDIGDEVVANSDALALLEATATGSQEVEKVDEFLPPTLRDIQPLQVKPGVSEGEEIPSPPIEGEEISTPSTDPVTKEVEHGLVTDLDDDDLKNTALPQNPTTCRKVGIIYNTQYWLTQGQRPQRQNRGRERRGKISQ